jgi:hypothetical protein
MPRPTHLYIPDTCGAVVEVRGFEDDALGEGSVVRGRIVAPANEIRAANVWREPSGIAGEKTSERGILDLHDWRDRV